MIRMGVGWGAWLGTLSPSVCYDGQKYIEPQSVCVETAVWQRSETAGDGGGCGESCFWRQESPPPTQNSISWGGSNRKVGRRETIKLQSDNSSTINIS